ncbi:hypothetical protein DFJ73DRAFT_829339 [Zopfochytrium polystomum]|nr:hypothetical protein DFJ73DRAFT_829339 [Zopfochytrium polystomum]
MMDRCLREVVSTAARRISRRPCFALVEFSPLISSPFRQFSSSTVVRRSAAGKGGKYKKQKTSPQPFIPVQLPQQASPPRSPLLDAKAEPVREHTSPTAVQVGDLVEIRKGVVGELGLVIKTPQTRSPNDSTSAFTYLALTSGGHYVQHMLKDILFHVPGWAFSAGLHKTPEPVAASSSPSAFLTTEILELLKAANIPPTILRDLSQFREEAERLAYETRDKRRSLHEHFTSSLSKTTITLDEAARWLFWEPFNLNRTTPVRWTELYAVYTRMMRDTRSFYPRSLEALRFRREMMLRQKAEGDKIDALERESLGTTPGPRLQSFLEKARARIAWARDQPLFSCGETESESGRTKPPQISFSESDWMFIDCIRSAVFSANGLDPQTTILKRGILPRLESWIGSSSTGSRRSASRPGYPWGACADSAKLRAIRLLTDLGAIYPWDNMAVQKVNKAENVGDELDSVDGFELSPWADIAEAERSTWGDAMLRELGLSGTDARKPSLTAEALAANFAERPSDFKIVQDKQLDQLVSTVRAKVLFPQEVLRDEFLTSTDVDSFDSDGVVRHDFGDLPVYVIDSPTAHELDDGISYEKRGENEEWIHVHIADPTSALPVSHPLSMLAQLRGSSLYLPERQYPMLPTVLSDKRFNLGILGPGGVQPVLTFSAKLTSDGEILDWAVQASYIRNVKILHYRNVNNLLRWDHIYGVRQNPLEMTPWQLRAFRDLLPSEEKAEEAANSDPRMTADLRRLQQLARSHLLLRVQRGGFISDQPGMTVKIPSPHNPLPHPPIRPASPLEAQFGDVPSVVVDPNHSDHLEPASNLVSECMILAGRVASQFCQDRKIPATYRGQPPPLDLVGPRKRLMEEALASIDPESGVIPFHVFRNLIPLLQGSVVDTRPVGHSSMGIFGTDSPTANGKLFGYVKVTSPLRRYSDLMMHWQIKAALCARRGAGASEMIPFRDVDIDRIAHRMHRVEKAVGKASQTSELFWALEWIRRREVHWRRGADASTVAGRPEGFNGEGLLMGATGIGPRDAAVWSDVYRGGVEDWGRVVGSSHDWESPVVERSQRPQYQLVVTRTAPARVGGTFAMGILGDFGGLQARLVSDNGNQVTEGDAVDCVVDTVDPAAGVLVMREI